MTYQKQRHSGRLATTRVPPRRIPISHHLRASAVRYLMTRLGRPNPVALDIAPPTADPFYDTPIEPVEGDHGEPIATRPVTIRTPRRELDLPAWQIRFTTTDRLGDPFASTATVVVPPWPGRGPQPLVSYQCAINSLNARGRPSYLLRRGSCAELSNIRRLLDKAFAVVTTDFAGPHDAYGLGETTGRSTLDGIAATLRSDSGPFDADTPIALWGYSGGANASLWATALASTYSPELPITTTTAGGSPVDIRALLGALEGTYAAAIGVAVVVGVAREHPEIDLMDAMTETGQHVLGTIGDMSLYEFNGNYPGVRWDDLLRDGLSGVPGLLEALDSAANHPPILGADLYLYYGSRDQLVPDRAVNRYVEQCRTAGSIVSLHRPRGVGHFTCPAVASRVAVGHIASALATTDTASRLGPRTGDQHP